MLSWKRMEEEKSRERERSMCKRHGTGMAQFMLLQNKGVILINVYRGFQQPTIYTACLLQVEQIHDKMDYNALHIDYSHVSIFSI